MSLLYGVIFGLMSMVAYGLQDYWGPIASRKIGAVETAMLIRLFAVLFFVIIFFFFFAQLPAFTISNLAILAITGVFQVAGIVSYYKGAKIGNISILSAIANSFAIVTVLLGFFFLSLTLTEAAIIGVSLLILGTILTSLSIKSLRKLKLTQLERGVEYGLLAMLSWGIAFFTVIFLIRQWGWFLAAFLMNVVMALFYVVFFKASRVKYVDPKSVIALLVLGGVVALVGISGYNLGVAVSNPLIVAPIAAASPAITILLAVSRLKEKLEPNHIVGIVLIILGLIVLSV